MRNYRYSILPCGTLIVKTGNTKDLGKVTELWPSSTFEVWQKGDGSHVAIATARESTTKIGEVREFEHDQRLTFLFAATFVKAIKVSEYKELSNYGKTIRIYCYK